ncbi:MAG: hypothetical protein ACJ714_03240 [Ornithinibacter sp.]
MSQLAPARPSPRTSPRRAATTAHQLKVVAPPQGQGNGLFLALCVALLLGGFVAVLVLNTAMAKGSYTMRDLQRRSDALADHQDALRHALDGVSGPGPLAQRARDLGMVPAATPAFLRLSDGKVLGVAQKAKADSTFSVVTETQAPTRSTPVATPPAPTATQPAGTASATATPEAGTATPTTGTVGTGTPAKTTAPTTKTTKTTAPTTKTKTTKPDTTKTKTKTTKTTTPTTGPGTAKPPVADPAPAN